MYIDSDRFFGCVAESFVRFTESIYDDIDNSHERATHDDSFATSWKSEPYMAYRTKQFMTLKSRPLGFAAHMDRCSYNKTYADGNLRIFDANGTLVGGKFAMGKG